MAEPNGVELIKRFGLLRDKRHNHESKWQRMAEYIMPSIADFTIKDRVPGEVRTQRVFDATAGLAALRFAALMMSLLTPRVGRWHRVKASIPELNRSQRVMSYFDVVTRYLFQMRERPYANYYNARYEAHRLDAVVGTSPMFLADPGSGGYWFRTDPLAQVYFATNERGVIDTAFKIAKVTHRAAKQRWGENNPALSQKCMTAKDPFEEEEYLTVVMPREEFDPERGRLHGASRPWTHIDVSMSTKQVLFEDGYFEFPWMVGRYERDPGAVYGQAPAEYVFPDVLTLNEQERVILDAGHMVVQPPLLLPTNGLIGPGGSRRPQLMRGGLNYGGMSSNGVPLVAPMVTGGRVDIGLDMQEQKRGSVRSGFNIDLFQLLVEHPQMTATEVIERAQEKGQLIAPLLGRLQSEVLGPQIQREINILSRQGMLPPMPPELLEAEDQYEIEYESPATRLQRMEEVAAVARATEIWAVAIEKDPTILSVLDGHRGFRDTLTILGAPQDWMLGDEQLEKKLADERAAAEALAVSEQLPNVGAGLKDLSEMQAQGGIQ